MKKPIFVKSIKAIYRHFVDLLLPVEWRKNNRSGWFAYILVFKNLSRQVLGLALVNLSSSFFYMYQFGTILYLSVSGTRKIFVSDIGNILGISLES